MEGINFNDVDVLYNIDLDQIFNGDFSSNQQIKKEDKNLCPRCGSDNLVISQGNLVCASSKCGTVIDNVPDVRPEWNRYGDDDSEDIGRCNRAVNDLLPRSSLGAIMTGYGNSRLMTLHKWDSMPYRERSLNNVFKKIKDMCFRGSIVKCIEDDACIMFKKISECKHVSGKNKGKYIITRGKNRESIIAACLYFSCRKNRQTRSTKEIADLAHIKTTEMNKGCKNCLKLLKIKKFVVNTGTSRAEHFVIRYCNELKIKQEYAQHALKIAKNIERINIASEHTPYSIAAVSILIMAEKNHITSMTKKKLSVKFDVSDVTLTKTYKKIERVLKFIDDDNAIDQIIKKINLDSKKNVMSEETKARMKLFEITTDEDEDDKLCNDFDNLSVSSDVSDFSDIDDEVIEEDDEEDMEIDNNTRNENCRKIVDAMKKCNINDFYKLVQLNHMMTAINRR